MAALRPAVLAAWSCSVGLSPVGVIEVEGDEILGGDGRFVRKGNSNINTHDSTFPLSPSDRRLVNPASA